MISDKLYEFLNKSALKSIAITEEELKTELVKSGFIVEEDGKNYKIQHKLHIKFAIYSYLPKATPLSFMSMVVANNKIVWTSMNMYDDEKRAITLPKDDFIIIQKPYLDIHHTTFSPDKFFENYQEIVHLPEPLKIILLEDLFHNMFNDVEDEMIMFESEFKIIKERMDLI